jgi:hypothetical protein
LDDFLKLVAEDFPRMTFTDKGGVIELSAHRGEKEATHRPPLLVMEFGKDSARALALEFYPENVDAFAEELPKAMAALFKWKAKHRDRCEMVKSASGLRTSARKEHRLACECRWDLSIERPCSRNTARSRITPLSLRRFLAALGGRGEDGVHNAGPR